MPDIKLGEKEYELVKTMMALTGIRSDAELLANALVFFSWALKAVSEGKEIAAVDTMRETWSSVDMAALKHAAELGRKSPDA